MRQSADLGYRARVAFAGLLCVAICLAATGCGVSDYESRVQQAAIELGRPDPILLGYNFDVGRKFTSEVTVDFDASAPTAAEPITLSLDTVLTMDFEVKEETPEGLILMNVTLAGIKVDAKGPADLNISYDSKKRGQQDDAAGVENLIGRQFGMLVSKEGYVVDVLLPEDASEALDDPRIGTIFPGFSLLTFMKTAIGGGLVPTSAELVEPNDTWTRGGPDDPSGHPAEMKVDYTYIGPIEEGTKVFGKFTYTGAPVSAAPQSTQTIEGEGKFEFAQGLLESNNATITQRMQITGSGEQVFTMIISAKNKPKR